MVNSTECQWLLFLIYKAIMNLIIVVTLDSYTKLTNIVFYLASSHRFRYRFWNFYVGFQPVVFLVPNTIILLNSIEMNILWIQKRVLI